MPADSDAAAAAKLRARIDAGATGDKVPFPDPAAAPLGTDDEAAGVPSTDGRTTAAEAAQPETKAGKVPDAGRLARGRDPQPRDLWPATAIGAVAIAAAVVVILLL